MQSIENKQPISKDKRKTDYETEQTEQTQTTTQPKDNTQTN